MIGKAKGNRHRTRNKTQTDKRYEAQTKRKVRGRARGNRHRTEIKHRQMKDTKHKRRECDPVHDFSAEGVLRSCDWCRWGKGGRRRGEGKEREIGIEGEKAV